MIKLLTAAHILEFAKAAESFRLARFARYEEAGAVIDAWRALDAMGVFDSSGIDERAEHAVISLTYLLERETHDLTRMCLDGARERYLIVLAESILRAPMATQPCVEPVTFEPEIAVAAVAQ